MVASQLFPSREKIRTPLRLTRPLGVQRGPLLAVLRIKPSGRLARGFVGRAGAQATAGDVAGAARAH
eukprot:8741100-Pyramimonas_sp.AAC.2